MRIKDKSKAVDTLGMITSTLCAIHCAALPILFSLGILGGASSVAHHSIELSVIVMSFGLGSWSIYQAMKSHKRLVPQMTIIAGIIIIVAGFAVATETNHNVMAIGGGILVLGHWINRRYISLFLAN